MIDFLGGLVDLLIILSVLFAVLLVVGFVMIAAWIALVEAYSRYVSWRYGDRLARIAAWEKNEDAHWDEAMREIMRPLP